MFKSKKLTCAIFFCVALFIPKFYYSGKPIHLSIDDVGDCMKEIADNPQEFRSIFQHPFFRKLKTFHRITGAKFTLYTYFNYQGYTISEFPVKFHDEFRTNSDWLRFGFHAINDTISAEHVSDTRHFISCFDSTNSHIARITGEYAKSLRLHYFYATRQEIDSLESRQILCLFSADDDRISYDLPKAINEQLIKSESLDFHNIHYERTDIRIENSNLIQSLYSNRNDDKIVIFTHEWALSSRKITYKTLLLLFFLKIYNSNFLI